MQLMMNGKRSSRRVIQQEGARDEGVTVLWKRLESIPGELPQELFTLFIGSHRCTHIDPYLLACFLRQCVGQVGILYGQVAGGNGKLGIAIHQETLVIGQSESLRVEVWNFSRDACRQRAGVEPGDRADTRAPSHAGVPEGVFADAIRCDDPQTRNHHSSNWRICHVCCPPQSPILSMLVLGLSLSYSHKRWFTRLLLLLCCLSNAVQGLVGDIGDKSVAHHPGYESPNHRPG